MSPIVEIERRVTREWVRIVWRMFYDNIIKSIFLLGVDLAGDWRRIISTKTKCNGHTFSPKNSDQENLEMVATYYYCYGCVASYACQKPYALYEQPVFMDNDDHLSRTHAYCDTYRRESLFEKRGCRRRISRKCSRWLYLWISGGPWGWDSSNCFYPSHTTYLLSSPCRGSSGYSL